MLSLATNGRKLCGRYTLLEKLGAGGQGEVWRARDDARGGDVALKVLSPPHSQNDAAWAALQHEYRIASQLDHRSILKIDEPLRDTEAAVLPMELATGGDLRRLRGLSYLEIVPALIELAQALEHAHDHAIIHRDLKPGNVLFDANGHVKLADFGVASGPAAGRTSGARGMSPFTASPEQLQGARPAITDDIYGLGALAYELLSGYPPHYPNFDLNRVLQEPAPELKPVHQAPPRLIQLVMGMLAKRPQLRPQSMRDVIDELDATLSDTLTFGADEVIDLPSAAPNPIPGVRVDHQNLTVATPEQAQARLGGLSGAMATPPRKGAAERAPVADQPLSAARKVPVGQALESLRRATAQEPVPAAPASAAQPQRTAKSGAPPAPTAPAASRAPSEPMRADRPSPTARREPAIAELESQARTEDKHTSWADLKGDVRVDSVPKVNRFAPVRPRRWPWVALALLGAGAAVVFFVLPRLDPIGVSAPDLTAATQQPATAPGPAAAPTGGSAPDDPAVPTDAEIVQRLESSRTTFDQQLANLETRSAGVWGGREFADAKARAAESVGAFDAGNPKLAEERLNEALRLLGVVEGKAPQALAAQLATGDRALENGDAGAARQAFELAKIIDPNNPRAGEGLQRAQNLDKVLPLLASAANAEAAKNYPRAVRDYTQVLAIDPRNTRAKAGLDRANAELGEDTYARAVGRGSSALAAGRLEDARTAYEEALRIRPSGPEARTGLDQVSVSLRTRGFASVRSRATALEAEERWSEALQEYEAALKIDPSLAFAQAGRTRAANRLTLATRLQALIDEPERLASSNVRAEAGELLKIANSQNPVGPVLRSQISRVQILLPEFDKPVLLALESDNSTQVAIPRIGSFGTFSRREIQLKPGKYTVIGTRVGYRDVRRDVTIAPGQEVQTISVRCVEPI